MSYQGRLRIWWQKCSPAVFVIGFFGISIASTYHARKPGDTDPRVVCPDAVRRGIRAPGLVPCWIAATQDRLYEFKKQNKLMASCTGDTDMQCSGVTAQGAPVKFKCDGNGCKFIAPWLW